MKNLLRAILLSVLAIAGGQRAIPQQPVPPPPKPTDSGPSFAVTMQFIQDKLNNQGQVGYVTGSTSGPGSTNRVLARVSDPVADPAACALRATKDNDYTTVITEGYTSSLTSDDLHSTSVQSIAASFKEIEKIAVESLQDNFNRQNAEQAHPEIIDTVTPAVFVLTLSSSKPTISLHSTYTQGKRTPQVTDTIEKEYTFVFREEETADRVAKAMVHAIELCGGGNKDPF